MTPDHPLRRRLLLAPLLSLALLASAGAMAGAAPPVRTSPIAPGPVPYQYMAKAATELLGRAPTPAEWRAGVRFFRAQGCSVASLRTYGEAVIASPEYRADYGHDPAATALTLFRFVLNREPGAAEFVAQRDALADGTAPETVARRLYASPEFATLTAPAICSPTNPSYYFGQPGHWTAYPAIPTPEHGDPGADLPEAPLQAALERLGATGGGTEKLPARAVVGLDTTLIIPSGVTLTTAGSPDPARYAEMARLVRLPTFQPLSWYAGQELVHMSGGSKLEHIWVDGQRDSPDAGQFSMYNVLMAPGIGTTVSDDRLGNTEGATNLQDNGSSLSDPPHPPCRGNVISGNLVEAYSSHHTPLPGAPPDDHPQADGLGVICESTTVTDNDIVDISDSAIVLFDGAPLVNDPLPQLSLVAHNTVVSAGNSYSFGIVTDGGYSLAPYFGVAGGDPGGVLSRSFKDPGGPTTARVVDNVLWSGDRTHINSVLNEGTHDLFGSTAHQNCLLPNSGGRAACGGGRNAWGAVWTGNNSAGLGVQAEMGIYVGGSDGSVFEDNRLGPITEVPGSGTCPRHAAVVATGNGTSTDFATHLRIDQPVYHDAALTSDSCITPSF